LNRITRPDQASGPKLDVRGAVTILGKELRLPDKHACAIPQLEAFEKVLALGKQRMSLATASLSESSVSLSTSAICPPRMK
jgi:hypothetical protein